ncbi:two-component regulator propeller domain-containing protein [Dyadobacter sp. CY326]|uniref:two-component regulator propeller domain-containing protein n=1 Tax=Dyadobacter sp. CY326 TaxID=2907300 RepID=UPI001F1F626A|nr:two-component regulator propeller domain-containing protein [Dyadobacter sp. CY326]MCE7068062.1 histidine kinase [Dyadobacter sp. CY326]
MNMRQRVTFLLIFWLIPAAIFGQTIFQNIKWQDGLSAKQVRCLYKDESGFLWIGTINGLDRFDGAVVKQYKNGTKQKNLLINAIHPLGKGDTLLLGLLNGVLLFDVKTGAFRKDSRFAALDKETVVTIKSDNIGRIWIGTNNKIFVFDKGKLQTLAAVIPAASAFGGLGFGLSSVLWDTTRNGFWIAGSKPYFIDIQNKALYHKEHNPLKMPVLNNSYVNAIAVDHQGNVWYGCDENLSLNFWNAKTGAVQQFFDLDGKKISDGINLIFIDHKDRLWISTWLFAAFIKEPGKPIKKIQYDQNLSYCIGYGHFRDAITDKEGNVWLGTINGVSKSQAQYPLQAIYQLPNFKFFLETGFAHANSIAVDKNLIMACKEDGLVAYNTDNRTYKRYMLTNDNLRKNRFVMAAKAKDAWWFVGDGGVHFLPNGGEKLVRFEDIKKNMPSQYANFVFTDHKGNIWFQILDDAIYRYDPVSKKTIRYDGEDSAVGLFDFKNSPSLLQLSNNDILFALPGSGLLRFDYKTERFSVSREKNLADMYVMKMVEDKKGDIWAAVSGKGLLKINQNGMLLDSIDSRNGLFYDYLSSIAIDSRGAIWGASREGLMIYNPDTRAVTKVEIDLGKTLQDYYNNLTFANGKIYAVMLDHILVIDPFSFAGTPVKKPPFITSLKVFGQEKLSLAKNDVIELEPDEDFVTFQFASLSHRDIPSLQYSYQLEGIDKNWVNAGRAITASYTNLLPGKYLFTVRSTDEFGRWMTKKRALQIVVKPNWWQTWWFILICVLIGSTFAVLLYRAYLQRKQQRRLNKTIDYFSKSVYGENSIDEICWDIARNCVLQLRFDYCVVYLLDDAKRKLIQKAAYDPNKLENTVQPEIGINDGIIGTVIASGEPLLNPDTSKAGTRGTHSAVKSELAVPVSHEGEVIGVIYSGHSNKNYFTDHHSIALSTVAAISANKIAEAIAKAQSQQKEMMLLQISKMLAESQLMALRAQMNPHFIFNCLNSIQECILTEKYLEASKYLNKFSKLFRTVLYNSGKNLITVFQERQVLELYLELELMRFDGSFSFEIIMDPMLEEDQITLPSMLLQPYVENALWHGLLHKDKDRKLRIEFKLIDEEVFLCRIQDNGIGRKKSFEIKAGSLKYKQHESQGLRITKDRIDLLNRQGNHAKLTITDLYEPDGTASGTLIEIELSTYLNNV